MVGSATRGQRVESGSNISTEEYIKRWKKDKNQKRQPAYAGLVQDNIRYTAYNI